MSNSPDGIQFLMKAATAPDEKDSSKDRVTRARRNVGGDELTPQQQQHQQQLAHAAQAAQQAIQQVHAAQQAQQAQQAQAQAQQQQQQAQPQPQPPPQPQPQQQQIQHVVVQQQPPPPQSSSSQPSVQQVVITNLPPGATPVIIPPQGPPSAPPPPSSFGPPIPVITPTTDLPITPSSATTETTIATPIPPVSQTAADAVAAAVAAANGPITIPTSTSTITIPPGGQGNGVGGNTLVTNIENETTAAYVACASGQDVQWKGGVWKLKNGHFSPEETQYILETVNNTRHLCPNLVECLKPISVHLNRAVRNVRAHYYHQRAPERHMRPKLHVGTRSDLDFYALASQAIRQLPNWEGDYLQVAEMIERQHPGELPTVKTLTGYLYVWQKSLGDFMGRHKHFVRTGRKNGGRVIYRFEPGWVTAQPFGINPDGTPITLQPGQTLIYQPGQGMATAPNGVAVHIQQPVVNIAQPMLPHDPAQLMQLYTSPAMQAPVPAVVPPPTAVPTPLPASVPLPPAVIVAPPITTPITIPPIMESHKRRAEGDLDENESHKKQAISAQQAAAQAVAIAQAAAASVVVQPTSVLNAPILTPMPTTIETSTPTPAPVPAPAPAPTT